MVVIERKEGGGNLLERNAGGIHRVVSAKVIVTSYLDISLNPQRYPYLQILPFHIYPDTSVVQGFMGACSCNEVCRNLAMNHLPSSPAKEMSCHCAPIIRPLTQLFKKDSINVVPPYSMSLGELRASEVVYH